MEPDMVDGLARYLHSRDRWHADRVAGFLAALTDRERCLVREAAVVGHRHGTTYPAGVRVPTDSRVYATVRENSTWRTGPALTMREQWLLREVAVMAFVRGTINREQLADDTTVEHVVACCQGMPDLYPIVAGDLRSLALKIVRLHPGAHRTPVADTLAVLGCCTGDAAQAVLSELLDDDRITETPDGFLRTAA